MSHISQELNTQCSIDLPLGMGSLPGLDPFDGQHAASFHGRAQDLDIMETLVEDNRVVLITGLRWTGKTSAIKAGLMTRLAQRRNATQQIVHYEDVRFGTKALASYLDGIREHGQMAHPYSSKVLIVDSFEELMGAAHGADGDEILRRLMRTVQDYQIGKLIICCRTECVAGIARQFPFMKDLLLGAASHEIKALTTRRVRQSLLTFSEERGFFVGESLLSAMVKDLQEVSALLGGAVESSSCTMSLVSLLMSHITRETAAGRRVYTRDLYQGLGGMSRLVGTLFEGLAARVPRGDLPAIAAAMNPTRCSGRRCRIEQGEQFGSRVDPLREICAINGSFSRSPISPPTLFIDVGEQGLILRYDAISALWPALSEELQRTRWDGDPLRHLAKFYFRVGKVPVVPGRESLGHAHPRTAGEETFMAMLRMHGRRRSLLRLLGVTSVVSATMVALVASISTCEYRDLTFELETDLLATQSASDIIDVLTRLDDATSSLDGMAGGSGEWKVSTALEVKLYSELLERRRFRSDLDEPWEERVLGDADAMSGACDAAVKHYRRALNGFLAVTNDASLSGTIELLYRKILECEKADSDPRAAITTATEFLDHLLNVSISSIHDSSRKNGERIAQVRLLRGRLYLAMNARREAWLDLEAAEEQYNILFEETGVGWAENIDVLFILGKMSMQEGKMGLATRQLERAQHLLEGKMRGAEERQRNEWLRHAHGQLAAIRALAGDLGGARTNLELELALAWDHLRRWDGSYASRRQVTSLYLRLGEVELAAKQWESARLRLQQGVSLVLEMKDLHEAFRDDELAAHLAVDYAQFLGALGDLALETMGPESALSYHERALELFGASSSELVNGGASNDDVLASLRSRMGTCHIRVGDLAAAVLDYEEETNALKRLIGGKGESDFSLRVRMGLAIARGAEAEYALGRVERAISKLDEAQAILDRLVQKRGNGDVDVAVEALARYVMRMKKSLGISLTGLEVEG